MSDNTKPNPKYYAGKIWGNPGGFALTAIAASAAMITPTLDTSTTPDQIGTDQEIAIMAEHEASFDALKQMRAELEYTEARAAATGDVADVSALKEAFGEKALESFVNLYTKGASQDGAALSEENFDNLRTTFANEIMDPTTFGFSANGALDTGSLDEILAETSLNTNNEMSKFQTAKALDDKMSEAGGPNLLLLLLAIAGSVTVFGAGLPFCAGTVQRWGSNEPNRMPRKKASKPGRYGQH